MIQNGIDCSNYYGNITQDWANAVVAAGIQRVTVRCSLERPDMVDIAVHQINAFRAAGATVDGYIWCYQKADDPDTLAARYQAAYEALGLPCVWLDLEDEDGWSYDDAASNIHWLNRALASFDALAIPCNIYTGMWYWTKPNRYANTTAFSDRLLWASDFDRNPDITVWHQYGGWDQAHLAGKQWCGESSGPEAVIAGTAVDRSVWDTDVLPGGDTNGGDDSMTDSQRAILNTEVIRNLDLALDSIGTALGTPRLPSAARTALQDARDNLAAGARPAAQTLARGEG